MYCWHRKAKSMLFTLLLPGMPAAVCAETTGLPRDNNNVETGVKSMDKMRSEESAGQHVEKSEERLMAERLLEEVSTILQSAHSQDASAVAAFLDAKEVVLRNIAFIKLREMGLPEKLVADCSRALAGIGTKDIETCKQAALAWARTYETGNTPAVPREVSVFECMLTLEAHWNWHVRYQKGTASDALERAKCVVGLSELAQTSRQKTLAANAILRLLDRSEVGREIELHKLSLDELHVDDSLRRLSTWLKNNPEYLYFHPVERTLKLDSEARSRGVSSYEYRKEHSWGPAEAVSFNSPIAD